MSHNDPWPDYVCAILQDPQGRLLLEQRPASAKVAAGRITCFGGHRETDESPEECLQRELREELDWEPATFARQIDLRVGGKLVAWFYHVPCAEPRQLRHRLPEHQTVLVPYEELAVLPVSPWHAATLEAWRAGQPVVELDG